MRARLFAQESIHAPPSVEPHFDLNAVQPVEYLTTSPEDIVTITSVQLALGLGPGRLRQCSRMYPDRRADPRGEGSMA